MLRAQWDMGPDLKPSIKETRPIQLTAGVLRWLEHLPDELLAAMGGDYGNTG